MKKLFVENTTVSLGGLSSDSEKSKKSLSSTSLSKELKTTPTKTEKISTPKSSVKKSPQSCLKRKSTGGRKSITFAKKIERVCTFSKEERTMDIKRDISPKTPEMDQVNVNEDKKVNDLYLLEEIKENLEKNLQQKSQDDEMTLVLPKNEEKRSPLKDLQKNEDILNESIQFVIEKVDVIEEIKTIKKKRELPQFERELPENYRRISLPLKEKSQEKEKRNSLSGDFKLVGLKPKKSIVQKSIIKTSPIIQPSPETLMEKPSEMIGNIIPDFTQILTTSSPNPFKKSPYQNKSKDHFSLDDNEASMIRKNLFIVPEKKTKTKVVSRRQTKKQQEEKKLKKMKNGIEVRSRKQKREEQVLKKQKIESSLSKNIYKEEKKEENSLQKKRTKK